MKVFQKNISHFLMSINYDMQVKKDGDAQNKASVKHTKKGMS